MPGIAIEKQRICSFIYHGWLHFDKGKPALSKASKFLKLSAGMLSGITPEMNAYWRVNSLAIKDTRGPTPVMRTEIISIGAHKDKPIVDLDENLELWLECYQDCYEFHSKNKNRDKEFCPMNDKILPLVQASLGKCEVQPWEIVDGILVRKEDVEEQLDADSEAESDEEEQGEEKSEKDKVKETVITTSRARAASGKRGHQTLEPKSKPKPESELVSDDSDVPDESTGPDVSKRIKLSAPQKLSEKFSFFFKQTPDSAQALLDELKEQMDKNEVKIKQLKAENDAHRQRRDQIMKVTQFFSNINQAPASSAAPVSSPQASSHHIPGPLALPQPWGEDSSHYSNTNYPPHLQQPDCPCCAIGEYNPNQNHHQSSSSSGVVPGNGFRSP